MRSHGVSMPFGGLLLIIWITVLVVSIVLVSVLNNAPELLRLWEVFYRIGSIIFGGGQVQNSWHGYKDFEVVSYCAMFSNHLLHYLWLLLHWPHEPLSFVYSSVLL